MSISDPINPNGAEAHAVESAREAGGSRAELDSARLASSGMGKGRRRTTDVRRQQNLRREKRLVGRLILRRLYGTNGPKA